MLQNVLLECRTGNNRRRDDGQCDPHPLAVEEEKQLVVRDRPAHTAPKMIHGRSGLVIPRRRIGEVVRCIQQRTIPQFVEVPVKLIRAGLGDVVDLRCSIPPLIHGIGKRVDGHFRNRIQSQDEVGREAAVEIGERIVRFQPVHDVAIGEGGQSVELHVAVPVAAADKVVAASRRVDQGPRRKLQRVG